MTAHSEKPILLFQNQQEWFDWLAENADSHDGVRLQLVRKASTLSGISYAEALDGALCYGWIDGQAQSLNDDYHLQSFTPRRARSMWSERNRRLVARLIDEGRMTARGLAEIDRAKADGRWDAAYAGQGQTEVPADLQAAIDASPAASAFFSTLTNQNRFAIVFRINGVKKAETRAAKIAGYVAMLERGETIYPQKPRPHTSAE